MVPPTSKIKSDIINSKIHVAKVRMRYVGHFGDTTKKTKKRKSETSGKIDELRRRKGIVSLGVDI